jgi:hypothetical protein
MTRTICPKCNRSLRNINAFHYCKEVDIDELFVNKSDDILMAFDKLLEHTQFGEDVAMSATKNCVVFVRNKTFLVVKPMTKWLEVKFYSIEMIEDEDLYKCHVWGGKYEGICRVSNAQGFKSKFFQYFRNSYLMS